MADRRHRPADHRRRHGAAGRDPGLPPGGARGRGPLDRCVVAGHRHGARRPGPRRQPQPVPRRHHAHAAGHRRRPRRHRRRRHRGRGPGARRPRPEPRRPRRGPHAAQRPPAGRRRGGRDAPPGPHAADRPPHTPFRPHPHPRGTPVRTAATELVGIDVPIFAFSHCRDVVAAVTNAGGFGVLGAVAHTPEQLDIDLAWIEEEVEGQALRRRPARPGEVRGLDEGGLDRDGPRRAPARRAPAVARRPARPVRRPAAARRHRDRRPQLRRRRHARRPQEHGAAARRRCSPTRPSSSPPRSARRRRTSSSGRTAPASRSRRWPGRVEHAVRHKAAGADLIVAQGTEAGGHTGQIATMVLVPEVVDAVGPAAGARRRRHRPRPAARRGHGARRRRRVVRLGVAHHRGGRDATRRSRRSSCAPGSGDTVRSRSITGKPARMLRTAWTDEWESRRGPRDRCRCRCSRCSSARRRRASTAWPARRARGANELATYFVGQVVGTQ